VLGLQDSGGAVRRQVSPSRRERAPEAAAIEKAVAQYEDLNRTADAEAAARYEGIVESLGRLHRFGNYEAKFGDDGSGEGPWGYRCSRRPRPARRNPL
jgi:hypothetical protein